MSNKVLWLVRRASVMPVREYVSRLFRLLRDISAFPLLKCFGAPKPTILKSAEVVERNSVFSDLLSMDMERDFPEAYRKQCIVEADCSLHHQFSFFELKEHCFGDFIQWNYDYKNKIRTPLRYSPFLNFRSFKVVGDVKYVFEHNKHQDLPRLAQAYHLTGDRRYFDEMVSRVDTWLEQCPFMSGVHWASPSVSAYRLVSWTLTFELLRDRNEFSEDFLERWAQSVYQHIHFISKNYSRFSSAGNHLISELVGVFVASLRWKSFFRGRKRSFLENAEKQALSILLTEIKAQVFSDGVNHEQSASYQLFSSNQMFIAYWIGTMSGVSFPAEFTERLYKSGEFLAAILDVCGQPPNFGDEDDAWAFRLASLTSNKFSDQLDVWSISFSDQSLMRGDTLSETAYWLFGKRAVNEHRSIESIPACTKDRQCVFEESYFSEGGYYVATFDRCTSNEVLLFLDSGPLGSVSTGGHGHADALSLCFNLGGIGVFVDSGTYSYKNTLERQRLKSTSAHNTLSFKSLESQDKYLGPFLWGSRHQATGNIVSPGYFSADVTWWSGERHCRETVVKKNSLKITDSWKGECLPSIAFHLNPQLQEFMRHEQDGISVETDVFYCHLKARDQCIHIEKTNVSPAFYQLRETLKFVIYPTSAKGSQITEITWGFK